MSSIEKNLATVPSSVWRAVLPSSPKELVTHLDSWWVFQWIVQLECFRLSSSLGRISTPKRCERSTVIDSTWWTIRNYQDLAFLSNLLLISVHSFAMVSAGYEDTVLLRSHGAAVACGNNEGGQCTIPPLGEGMSYTQVSAGGDHTVLQCFFEVMALQLLVEPMMMISVTFRLWIKTYHKSYTEVSAGEVRTVLLQSDGAAVACGDNPFGQCNIPSLKTLRELLSFAPRRYTCHDRLRFSDPVGVLQLDLACQADALMLTCSSLAGLIRCCPLQRVGLTLLWTLTGRLPRSWMLSFTVFEWSCRMDSCWPQSTRQILIYIILFTALFSPWLPLSGSL